MLMDDAPPTPRLFVDIGNPHGEIQLLALLVSAGHPLDAVAVGEVAVGSHVEVGQPEGDRAVEAAEESLPIFAVGRGAAYCRGGTTSKTTSVWSGA